MYKFYALWALHWVYTVYSVCILYVLRCFVLTRETEASAGVLKSHIGVLSIDPAAAVAATGESDPVEVTSLRSGSDSKLASAKLTITYPRSALHGRMADH